MYFSWMMMVGIKLMTRMMDGCLILNEMGRRRVKVCQRTVEMWAFLTGFSCLTPTLLLLAPILLGLGEATYSELLGTERVKVWLADLIWAEVITVTNIWGQEIDSTLGRASSFFFFLLVMHCSCVLVGCPPVQVLLLPFSSVSKRFSSTRVMLKSNVMNHSDGNSWRANACIMRERHVDILLLVAVLCFRRALPGPTDENVTALSDQPHSRLGCACQRWSLATPPPAPPSSRVDSQGQGRSLALGCLSLQCAAMELRLSLCNCTSLSPFLWSGPRTIPNTWLCLHRVAMEPRLSLCWSAPTSITSVWSLHCHCPGTTLVMSVAHDLLVMVSVNCQHLIISALPLSPNHTWLPLFIVCLGFHICIRLHWYWFWSLALDFDNLHSCHCGTALAISDAHGRRWLWIIDNFGLAAGNGKWVIGGWWYCVADDIIVMR